MSGDWVSPRLTSGLGNRLFQYAAAAGLAETWGREVVFYLPALHDAPHGAIASLFRMYPSVRLVEEPVAGCAELEEDRAGFYTYSMLPPFPESGAPTLVRGFRQSPRYFPRDLSRLQPDWDSAIGPQVRRLIERMAKLERGEERRWTVALHVRLGDYRMLPHHQVPLSGYYAAALAGLPSGVRRIHLFSDEPHLCVKAFQEIAAARGLELTVAIASADVESLYEMSLCLGGTIVANSTFSWWGAWFAHAAGADWATMPDVWGQGQPRPRDLFPPWATVLRTGL